VIGFIEGISFLVLLLIAMPLKYLAGQPEAVRIVGTAHGALFVLYVLALLLAAFNRKWQPGIVLGGFIASVVPLGPFVFDRWLKTQDPDA